MECLDYILTIAPWSGTVAFVWKPREPLLKNAEQTRNLEE